MRLVMSFALGLYTLLGNSLSFAAGPDVIVGFIDGAAQHGNASPGRIAFTAGTTSCNIGDSELSWRRLPDNAHPVIALNLYRLQDGRMHQLAASWVKHGFFATNEDHCRDLKDVPACSPSASNALGPGCSDPYNASLNANPNWLGPRSKINPTTGTFDGPNALDLTGFPNSTTEDKTLQVDEDDLRLVGSRFFLEAHYITADDAGSSNSRNNVSFREVEPILSNGRYTLQFRSVELRGEPAITAWPGASFDELVEEKNGRKSFIIVASKANQITGGRYRYDYAIYNMNSQSAISGFEIQRVLDAQDVSFSSAVPNGERWSTEDWKSRQEQQRLGWFTQGDAQEPTANLIRWGTTYSFSFTSAASPVEGDAILHTVDMENGAPNEFKANITAPTPE